MSVAARQSLVNDQHMVFQRDSQRSDLLDPSVTQTGLIANLQYLVDMGHHIEITAVRSDHGDDSALGEHCHANGYCADLWPLADATPGNYVDAGAQAFRDFLEDLAKAPYLYQIGLAGTADTPTNEAAAGPSVFSDDGADHVHLGSQN